MKVKLGELLDCSGTRTLANGQAEGIGLAKIMLLDLPTKVAYRFTKLSRIVEREREDYQKFQRKLFEKYGEPEIIKEVDFEGKEELKATGNLRLRQDCIEDYSEEIKNLFDEEIEINFLPVSLSELDGIKLSPVDISILLPFLIVEEDCEVAK